MQVADGAQDERFSSGVQPPSLAVMILETMKTQAAAAKGEVEKEVTA